MTDYVGIVVVSHSAPLAQAAVDLAMEMVTASPPPVAIAAGASGGGTGTDAMQVVEAINQVASPAGVLVLMDMGSAVLSAEMALEFLDDPGCEVRLSSAPFVEGLTAAVVQSASGSTLDQVASEAMAGLLPKSTHLGDAPAAERAPAAGGGEGGEVLEIVLPNPHGLHARPAAALVTTVSSFEAQVHVTNVSRGTGPVDGRSLISIIALGADEGHQLRIAADGPQATEALAALRTQIEAGFGEL